MTPFTVTVYWPLPAPDPTGAVTSKTALVAPVISMLEAATLKEASDKAAIESDVVSPASAPDCMDTVVVEESPIKSVSLNFA